MNIKSVSHNGINFVYSSKPGQTEINYLRNNFEFSLLHLEDHVNKTELPKIDSTKKYVLIVLGIPNVGNGEAERQEQEENSKNGTADAFKTLLNIPQKTLSYIPIPKFSSDTKKDRISTVYIDIYVGRDYVVFLSDGIIPQINHVFEVCHRTAKAREEFLGQGPGFLAYRIIDALLDGYLPVINSVSATIDKIDREIEKKQSPGTLEEMSITRRNIVVLHTMIKTTIPIFKKLRDGVYEELDGTLSSYWANALNHSESFLERLEDDRELIEGISESNEFILRTKSNEIMTTLTIVFTLTFPASLLGTFYGMNIMLPGGVEAGRWTFWGPFTTLYIIGGIAILFMIAMILYFKHRRWF